MPEFDGRGQRKLPARTLQFDAARRSAKGPSPFAPGAIQVAHAVSCPTFRTLKTQFGVNFCLPWQPKGVFRDAEQGENLAL